LVTLAHDSDDVLTNSDTTELDAAVPARKLLADDVLGETDDLHADSVECILRTAIANTDYHLSNMIGSLGGRELLKAENTQKY
jgi:hypothetical protein